MSALLKWVNGPPNRLLYWAIFRVYLALHLTNQIVSYLFLRDLLFSDNSFIPLSSIGYARFFQQHIVLFLLGYLFLVVAMGFGIGRNLTVLLVFGATKTIQSMNSYILNGGHNFLTFLLLYLCFADSFKYLVLNKSPAKAHGAVRSLYDYVTNLATACVLMHLSLIYLISGLAKAHSDVWYHGDALYYIFLVERFQGLEWNATLAQNGLLVAVMTYSVMLWELYFPALVWVPRLRVPVLVAGLLMHIGICISMMLYDFEILFAMTYGFFFRDDQIERILRRGRHALEAWRERFGTYWGRRIANSAKR